MCVYIFIYICNPQISDNIPKYLTILSPGRYFPHRCCPEILNKISPVLISRLQAFDHKMIHTRRGSNLQRACGTRHIKEEERFFKKKPKYRQTPSISNA